VTGLASSLNKPAAAVAVETGTNPEQLWINKKMKTVVVCHKQVNINLMDGERIENSNFWICTEHFVEVRLSVNQLHLVVSLFLLPTKIN